MVDGQEHFARYSHGTKHPIPLFSGSKGPEIARSLKEIEHTFGKLMSMLQAVESHMLDVKATSWHDEYNKYRAGIKDLEVMLQNVINSSFGNITTIQEGVELLDVFTQFIGREVRGILVLMYTVHVCILTYMYVYIPSLYTCMYMYMLMFCIYVHVHSFLINLHTCTCCTSSFL